jgi:transcription elongation factor
MTNHEFRDSRRQAAERLVVGQKVEIRCGPLQGFSGVVVGFAGDGKCFIELDGMNRGILLSIAATSVRGVVAE